VKKTLKVIHLPEGMTEIPVKLFSQCEALEKVYMPSTLTKIGESAFSGCISLNKLEIPDSVTEIGDNLFGSTWQAEAHIPKVIVCGRVGSAAQELAARLKCRFVDVTLDEETRRLQEKFIFIQEADGLIITDICIKDREDVEIPEKIGGVPVRGIKCEEWINAARFKVPASVRRMEANLTQIDALEIHPDNSSILQDGLLWYSEGGRVLGGLLKGAKQLDEIVVREGTEEMYSESFGFGTKMKRLVLPASLQKAGWLSSWQHVVGDCCTVIGQRGSLAEALARACECPFAPADDSEEVRALREIFPSFAEEDGRLCLIDYRGTERDVIVPEEIGGQKIGRILGWRRSDDPDFPRSVRLGASVTKLENVCLAEECIEVDKANPVFFSDDGKLYARNPIRLVFCPPLADMAHFHPDMEVIGGQALPRLHAEVFTVPEGVKGIEFASVKYSRDVKIGRLVLSQTVKSMEYCMFAHGVSIKEIVLGMYQAELIPNCRCASRIIVLDEAKNELCTLMTSALSGVYVKSGFSLLSVLEQHDAAFEAQKDAETKIYMALHRINQPFNLTDENKEKMSAYLRRQVKKAAGLLIEEGNERLLRVLLAQGLITKKNVQPLLDLCGEKGRLQMSALLLEYTQGGR